MESCSHCGREVRPTFHRRRGETLYQVDYYRLLTGELSKMVMQDQRDESKTVEFYKLTQPRFVITCVDCFAREEVRAELEELFSGVPAEQEDEQAQG